MIKNPCKPLLLTKGSLWVTGFIRGYVDQSRYIAKAKCSLMAAPGYLA